MKVVALGEVAGKSGLIVDGDWVESKDQDPVGSVRLTQLADVGIGEFLDKSARFMTEDAARRLKCTYLQQGDILVARMPDPIGRACIFPGSDRLCVTVVDVCIVRPDPSVANTRYLNWAINSPQFQNGIDRYIQGSTRQRISRKNLERVEIPLPPLDEQKRIAAILDQADELRQLRQRAIDRLNELGQAIFYEMFGDKLKFSDNQHALDKHISFITSGGRGWAKYYAPSGKRFVRSLDVQMNRIGRDDIVYVAAPNNAEARRTVVNNGDVLLTITGSKIGRVSPAPPELDGAFISQHVAIIRLDRRSMDPTFLSFYLSLEDGGQRQIQKTQYGQAKPGLNFEQIRSFRVPEIKIENQIAFRERLETLANIRRSSEVHISQTGELFRTLQYRAFSGEL